MRKPHSFPTIIDIWVNYLYLTLNSFSLFFLSFSRPNNNATHIRAIERVLCLMLFFHFFFFLFFLFFVFSLDRQKNVNKKKRKKNIFIAIVETERDKRSFEFYNVTKYLLYSLAKDTLD